MTDVPVVRLDESRIDGAAAVLGRAFFDDPLERYVLPDDRKRLAASTARFRGVLRYGHLFGEVWTAPESPKAVAMWLLPGETDMTDERMEQAGMFGLPSIVGQDAFTRFIAVLDVLDGFHASDVSVPHWYLLVVGVDPPEQRRGLGSALIKPMLARADAEGVPCYLETTSEQNIGLYKHLGFDVVHDVVEPISALRLWTFRRDPPGR